MLSYACCCCRVLLFPARQETCAAFVGAGTSRLGSLSLLSIQERPNDCAPAAAAAARTRSMSVPSVRARRSTRTPSIWWRTKHAGCRNRARSTSEQHTTPPRAWIINYSDDPGHHLSRSSAGAGRRDTHRRPPTFSITRPAGQEHDPRGARVCPSQLARRTYVSPLALLPSTS